jgi:hypothetical protein
MASGAETIPRLESHRLQFLRSVAPDLTPILDNIHGPSPKEAGEASSVSQWTPDQLRKIHIANSIADLSSDDAVLSRGLIADPDVLSLRDIANKYSTRKLAEMLEQNSQSSTASDNTALKTPAAPVSQAKLPTAVLAFQAKIFHREPSAVVARMVRDSEIQIGSISQPVNNEPEVGDSAAALLPVNPIKDGVVQFFNQNPDFNIREMSVLSAITDPKTME